MCPWNSSTLLYCMVLYNQTTQLKKVESYIPSTTHPPKYLLTSLSAFLIGLFWGLNRNECTYPDPAIAASPEAWILWFPKLHLIGYRHIVEEDLEGVGSWFGSRGGDKLCPATSWRSDPALEFFTACRSITPIWMTSVFWSHPSNKFGIG